MSQPMTGAHANLMDVVAQVINRAVPAGCDSTGQPSHAVRTALLHRLQAALDECLTSPAQHNAETRRAMERSL